MFQDLELWTSELRSWAGGRGMGRKVAQDPHELGWGWGLGVWGTISTEKSDVL